MLHVRRRAPPGVDAWVRSGTEAAVEHAGARGTGDRIPALADAAGLLRDAVVVRRRHRQRDRAIEQAVILNQLAARRWNSLDRSSMIRTRRASAAPSMRRSRSRRYGGPSVSRTRSRREAGRDMTCRLWPGAAPRRTDADRAHRRGLVLARRYVAHFVERLRCRDLRRSQTLRLVAPLLHASACGWTAFLGRCDDPVLHTIAGIARRERRLLNDRQLGGRR